MLSERIRKIGALFRMVGEGEGEQKLPAGQLLGIAGHALHLVEVEELEGSNVPGLEVLVLEFGIVIPTVLLYLLVV